MIMKEAYPPAQPSFVKCEFAVSICRERSGLNPEHTNVRLTRLACACRSMALLLHFAELGANQH